MLIFIILFLVFMICLFKFAKPDNTSSSKGNKSRRSDSGTYINNGQHNSHHHGDSSGGHHSGDSGSSSGGDSGSSSSDGGGSGGSDGGGGGSH